MRKSIMTLVCVAFTALTVTAQKADITGLVKSEEESLISATVVLLSEQDSTMISFGLTNDEGAFKLASVPFGKYLLQVTYLGYEQFSENVDVQEKVLNMGDIILLPSSNQLDAVEIKGEHVPMMMKKDTFEYNADAFQVKPNEMVEDLLKKLPGVEVEQDGTIKAQGEEVQQVLVDGKKFFGDDPKIATKNLPADAVKKVQIYDKKSDAAEFSGVDDGERQKTINLDLKEGRKAGAFGNISAGYGTDDRYRSTLSLNRFAGKTQISLIGNVNNVNEQGFSSGDYFSFMRGVGWGRNSGMLGPSFGLSDGFVDTKAGGVNINYEPWEKTDITFSYFVNSISNEVSSTSTRENFVDEADNFFTNTAALVNNGNDNHRFNLEIEQEIDSTQDIRLRGSLSMSDANSMSTNLTETVQASGVVQNSTDATVNTLGDNFQLSLNGTYRKKFGSFDKRILTLSGSYNDGVNESVSDLLSDNLILDRDTDTEIITQLIQDQINEDNASDYRVELSFVEPLSNDKFLELKYRRQNYNNNVLSEFYDLRDDERIFNLDLSNAFNRDYYFDRYSIGMYFNTDKSQLNLEAAVQSSHLRGDIIFDEQVIETDVFRFLPRMSWRYEIKRGQNIRMNYNTSINEPSLTQLQPNPDNTNPLNIYIGNPELVPEYNHRLTLNYFSYDQFNAQNLYAFINMNYTRNDIVNVVTFDQNLVQTTTPENVAYNLNVSGTQGFSRPFNPLKLRFEIRNRIGYNKSFVFINGEQTDLQRINGNVRLQIENRNKEVIDWSVGGSYGYNVNRYSGDSANNISYNSQNTFADVTYYHKKSFSVSSRIDVDFYSQEQFGEAQTVPIWTASISKYFLADQRGEFKLSAFDLLNRNLGISRVENQNYVENSEVISLGRYFMASFIYAIKPAGKKSEER